jgi:hypothetical protein
MTPDQFCYLRSDCIADIKDHNDGIVDVWILSALSPYPAHLAHVSTHVVFDLSLIDRMNWCAHSELRMEAFYVRSWS